MSKNNSDFDSAGRFRFADSLSELRASRAGSELGRRFAGDPSRAAVDLGYEVCTVPAASIQNSGRPLFEIRGRTFKGSNLILVSDALTPRARARTVAHELGHQRGFDSERDADAFATAFLREQPDPFAARRRDREWLQERERAVARSQAVR